MAKSMLALAAASLLVTSNAAAAELAYRDVAMASGAAMPQSMFLGMTLRLERGTRSAAIRPRAAMTLTGMRRDSTSMQPQFGRGLELAFDATSRPTLSLAGTDIRQFGKRASMSGGTTVALAIAGVVLVGGLVLLATHCDNDCENAKNE